MSDLEDVLASNPRVAAFLRGNPRHRGAAEALVVAGLGGTIAKYVECLDDAGMATFFADVAGRDFAWIRAHRDALLHGHGTGAPEASDLAPIEPGTLDGPGRAAFEAAGRASLAAGEWASLVFAGGAATRFYSHGSADPRLAALTERFHGNPPKGLFPLTPVAGRCFLDLFLAEALAAGVEAGRMPVVVLMTSRVTDQPTREWVETAPLKGFPRRLLVVLGQTEQPRLDPDGDLVVGPDGRLVVTGDGHGGVYKALLAPGPDGVSVAARLGESGVRRVVLHNVDNASSWPFEPARLGFHAAGGHAFTMTVVPRARLSEKVGLVARNVKTGAIEVVEYSVCPKEVTEAAAAEGTPLYRLAHINTNLADLRAIRPDVPPTLYTGKKVEIGGRVVESSSFEMLNQHLSGLLPAASVGVLLVDRHSYFHPTKSLSGEDSLEETTAALAAEAADRLRAAGASVDPTALVEIDPCLPDLAGAGVGDGWVVGPGAAVYLGVREGAGGRAWGPGLRVGAGARLEVHASMPYGDVQVAADRQVTLDPSRAGRLSLGRDVVVEDGADVRIRIEGDGCAMIPDGARLRGRIDLFVPAGARRVVGSP